MEVAIRVYRILRHLTSYVAIDAGEVVDGIIAESDETILGVYRNDPIHSQSNIVVSDQGLRWWDESGAVAFVRFTEIESVTVVGEKTTAETIRLSTKQGEAAVFKIQGGEGKLREVWGFYHFLIRVLSDLS